MRGAGPAAGRPECHPGEPPQAEPCPSHACWTGVCRPHAPAPRSGPSSRGRAEPRGRRERPAGREGAFVVCCPGPTVDSAQRGGRRRPSADTALVTARRRLHGLPPLAAAPGQRPAPGPPVTSRLWPPPCSAAARSPCARSVADVAPTARFSTRCSRRGGARPGRARALCPPAFVSDAVLPGRTFLCVASSRVKAGGTSRLEGVRGGELCLRAPPPPSSGPAGRSRGTGTRPRGVTFSRVPWQKRVSHVSPFRPQLEKWGSPICRQ